MTLSNRITTAVAVLLVATGSLAAQNAAQYATQNATQNAAQNAAAPDPQVPAAAAPAAQQTQAGEPAADPALSLAPFAANAAVGIHQAAPSEPAPYVPAPRDHVGTNVAMMIVGGAGLIVGAIVGGNPGTVIMVAGGIVGLVGLFKYLQ
jgi:hypothetical protein